jgi:hypothetical protein
MIQIIIERGMGVIGSISRAPNSGGGLRPEAIKRDPILKARAKLYVNGSPRALKGRKGHERWDDGTPHTTELRPIRAP